MKLIKTYNGNYINADNVTVFEIHHDSEKNSDKITGQIVARMPQINLNSRGCTHENLLDRKSERYEYERDVFRYIISAPLYVEDAEKLFISLMEFLAYKEDGIFDIDSALKAHGIEEYRINTVCGML
jgi:hypothetical protein